MKDKELLDSLPDKLIAWYGQNARPLPWRGSGDPYHIWLSEVMLQQTRIEAVKPYYARFLAAAPTVKDLAALPDDSLMKLWEGLGYYSRARNLKKAAIAICKMHGGKLPADHAALRALPGVGDYTAGAIASIAFGLPYPAVDGNVLRVLTRVLGDRRDVLQPATKKDLTARLSSVYSGVKDPASLTQGLMELGEVLCLPKGKPRCDECPLASICRARAEGSFFDIPYRAPKKGRHIQHKLVLILHDGEGHYAIRRRPAEGLLAGLFELPQIDLPAPLSTYTQEERERMGEKFCQKNGLLPTESASAPEAKHIFTHLEWHMAGLYINVRRGEKTAEELLFVSREALTKTYALPSAFRTYAGFITNICG